MRVFIISLLPASVNQSYDGHMLLSLDPDYPNLKKVANAVYHLRQGGLLAFPTDTTYGVGADPFQPKAVSALFELTRRDPKKPASLLCSDIRMASDYAVISDPVFRAMKRVLPGPYTFIMPATVKVPRGMHGKRREVGIRIPKCQITQKLIETLGTPLLSVSLRDAEGAYLGEAQQIEDLWGHQLEAVIDTGGLVPQESTVIEIVDDAPVVLRHGVGSLEPLGLW